MWVGSETHELPATLTFVGDRHDLKLSLPTPSGGRVEARGEIQFSDDYRPTDVDRYARLRAVFTSKLIQTVAGGGAAVFTGYSATNQEVFRLLFGKE